MNKTNPPQSTTERPFFDLLSQAEEIKVREVCPENQERIASLVEKQMDAAKKGLGDYRRTFLVQVQTRPAPETVPKDPNSKTKIENRTYLLKSAELLLAESDFILARNIFSYLLKINIRDQEALEGLGICFAKLGDPTSAKKCFRALWEIAAKPDALVWLGQALSAEGEDSAALEHFLKVTDPNSLSESVRFERWKEMGNCQTRLGDFDSAADYYRKALTLNPHSEAIHINLGTLEIQRNHPDEACAHLQKAAELNPRSSKAYSGLGLVASVRGQKELASIYLKRALDIDGRNVVALYQWINLAHTTGSYTDAKAAITEFLKRDPQNSEMRYALATLLYKEGDWTGCAKELDAVLLKDPGHAKAKSLLRDLSANKHRPV